MLHTPNTVQKSCYSTVLYDMNAATFSQCDSDLYCNLWLCLAVHMIQYSATGMYINHTIWRVQCCTVLQHWTVHTGLLYTALFDSFSGHSNCAFQLHYKNCTYEARPQSIIQHHGTVRTSEGIFSREFLNSFNLVVINWLSTVCDVISWSALMMIP